MVISFFALVPQVSALDFTIDAPDNVVEDVPFDVMINFDASESYDVKIFAHQGDKNSYISQVKDGEVWRSPRTYMKEAFPAQQMYEINILDFAGEADLCVRLRKTGASSFSELCQPINVGETIREEIEEEFMNEEIKIDSPVKQENKMHVNPLRTRIVYAFMIFCAVVIGLLWFEKL